MAVVANGRVFHGGYRFDSQIHTIALDIGTEEVDNSVLGDPVRTSDAGLETRGLAYSGYWEGGDDKLEGRLNADTGDVKIITVSHNVAADGDECYFGKYTWVNVTPFQGTVGDAHEVTGDAAAKDTILVRGTYIHNAAVTTTGTGAAVQAGAVAADEKLYAVLHVIDSSGDGSQTLDVTIESDDASGFASPTTQITFSQVTTDVGAQYATPVDGAITDDWWRTSHTVGGTGSPSFTYIVAIGIQ